ncbi:Uncharacterised protein [Mycobacteroides abscessus subsp. bolletii]|nr:Uncharacterised protein [Mycobacteroides abscessus subsp. bolletii]
MVNQLKDLATSLPGGVYSLLAAIVSLLGAVLLQNKKVKALQEVAEKNISILNELPEGFKARDIYEQITVIDAEKIINESTKKKDWNSISIGIVLLVATYFIGLLAISLIHAGGWGIIGAVLAFILAGFTAILGSVGLFQGVTGTGQQKRSKS